MHNKGTTATAIFHLHNIAKICISVLMSSLASGRSWDPNFTTLLYHLDLIIGMCSFQSCCMLALSIVEMDQNAATNIWTNSIKHICYPLLSTLRRNKRAAGLFSITPCCSVISSLLTSDSLTQLKPLNLNLKLHSELAICWTGTCEQPVLTAK